MQIGDKNEVSYLLDELQKIDIDAAKISTGSVDVTLAGRYLKDYLSSDELEIVKEVVLRWLAKRMHTVIHSLYAIGVTITGADGLNICTEEDSYRSLRSRFF